MKKHILYLIAFLFCGGSAFSQIRLTQDPILEKQLYETGLIHSPLPLDISQSYEAIGLKKKVGADHPLAVDNNLSGWTHSGWGNMVYNQDKTTSGKGSLKLSIPTSTGKRATGSPNDPDYATYGHSRITYTINGENWENYNRIAFNIYPDCDGARVVNMNLTFENDNSINKPGYNHPSGGHLINLVNKQWNRCFLDID